MGDETISVQSAPAAPVPTTDKLSYRLVVIGLIVISVGTIGGTCVMAYQGKTPPPELATLCGSALGALAGILSPLGK